MDEKFKDQLQNIIAKTPCNKNFNCLANDLKNLCKAVDLFGNKNYVECIEDDPSLCKFALPVGKRYICDCPIRKLIKRQLDK